MPPKKKLKIEQVEQEKSRKGNFTIAEIYEIVKYFRNSKSFLKNESQSAASQGVKRELLKELANDLNSRNERVQRTPDEIFKKYKNLEIQAKNANRLRNEISRGTGGGPSAKELENWQKIILDEILPAFVKEDKSIYIYNFIL